LPFFLSFFVYCGICFILLTLFPLLSPLGALMPKDFKEMNHVTASYHKRCFAATQKSDRCFKVECALHSGRCAWTPSSFF
jgi:hypothetical protein